MPGIETTSDALAEALKEVRTQLAWLEDYKNEVAKNDRGNLSIDACLALTKAILLLAQKTTGIVV